VICGQDVVVTGKADCRADDLELEPSHPPVPPKSGRINRGTACDPGQDADVLRRTALSANSCPASVTAVTG
jgi:hypothetical protein